jgi:protein-tyrosine phosphatase
VAENVWLGRLPTRAELDRHAIAAIIDMTAELPVASAGRGYVNLPALDLVPPDAATLAQAAREIEGASAQGRVLVCCALGYSRSAAGIAAWLIATGRAAGVDAAVARIAQARPDVVLGEALRDQVTAAAGRQALP